VAGWEGFGLQDCNWCAERGQSIVAIWAGYAHYGKEQGKQGYLFLSPLTSYRARCIVGIMIQVMLMLARLLFTRLWLCSADTCYQGSGYEVTTFYEILLSSFGWVAHKAVDKLELEAVTVSES
jgi:hypothetical protein